MTIIASTTSPQAPNSCERCCPSAVFTSEGQVLHIDTSGHVGSFDPGEAGADKRQPCECGTTSRPVRHSTNSGSNQRGRRADSVGDHTGAHMYKMHARSTHG